MIILINGVSGTGKTSTAASLAPRIKSSAWVHPDELWETTSMDSETILDLAVRYADELGDVKTVIIDCQIRPLSIANVLSTAGWNDWLDVLLICPKEIREQRLLERGWDSTDFTVIEKWADLLHRQAKCGGKLIIDTSNCNTEQVCAQIEQYLETPGMQINTD